MTRQLLSRAVPEFTKSVICQQRFAGENGSYFFESPGVEFLNVRRSQQVRHGSNPA
ncbi:MAG: hypothetical protein SFU53_06340 [Terrimicrobiaceae bacterium]|nr:hypothetical protein [Terrimicrobiaceae bacterium]